MLAVRRSNARTMGQQVSEDQVADRESRAGQGYVTPAILQYVQQLYAPEDEALQRERPVDLVDGPGAHGP